MAAAIAPVIAFFAENAAVITAATAVASTGYSIYAGEEAKDRAEEQRQQAEQQAREAAEAQAKYDAEMAAAKADADRIQAEREKAELERQAEAERIRSEQEAADTTALGERIKKAQRASSAKAGLAVDTGTAGDILGETENLTARDVKTILTSSGEKQTALKQMGYLGLQTALESGELMKKGAAGQGDLLKLKAKQTGETAALQAKMNNATATASQVGSLFSLANTLLGQYKDYKKEQQSNFNFYNTNTRNPYGTSLEWNLPTLSR